jgi:hypothetical protein
MKKYLLTLAIILFFGQAFTQEEDNTSYEMFELIYLTPKTESIWELMEALAEHNKTFHQEGPYKSHVWMINTGPHTGDICWAMGPCTFTELDDRPNDMDHTEHWMKNVMPHVKKVTDGEYWKKDDKLSYDPEAEFSGKEIWAVYDIKPFEGYRFTALLEKVKKVYDEKSYPYYFNIYRSQFDGGKGHDVAIAFGFKNYSFFDEEDKFWKDYEDVHGEGSRWKFFEEYRDVVVHTYDELSEYNAYMSGAEEE